MKSLILCVLLTFIFTPALQQDHFEKKIEKANSIKFASLIAKGIVEFDFFTIPEKTLLIPKYSPNSIQQKFCLNKQYNNYKSLEEKQKYYEMIWNDGIRESTFNECDYKVSDIDFNRLSNDEKKKYLYLSFFSTMGFNYVTLWYVNERGEELPAFMILVVFF